MESTQEGYEVLERTVKSIQESSDSAASMEVAAAAISATLSIGPAGGNLQGWITYLGNQYGKIHFKNGKVISHTGLYAGAFAFPAVPVALPNAIIGKKGRVLANGSGPAGVVTLWAGGTLVGDFPIAGAGLPTNWSFEADMNYTKG